LLERHPEHVGHVVFHARVVPTRVGVPEYDRELDMVRSIVGRINQRFGRSVDLEERQDRGGALAELAAADVVLVNSVADGMNLVAKEAAVLGRPSALVLSRRAGAYEELAEGAIGIEPADVDETCEALHQAIRMPPAERETRARVMSDTVRAWTSRDQFRAVLDDLDEAGTEGRSLASPVAS
ncbi:MAG TPA: trehalose-6-phosphate synthase, partial [Gaiellaceae bacterium]|nr:trehalose-6-phosphate synthase [Gaiellaceae bacterium]